MHRVYIRVLQDRQQAISALKEVGADAGGVKAMAPKAEFLAVSISDVPIRAAIILKEEMLALGAEAALSRGVGNLSVEKTDMLLLGTRKQFFSLLHKLKAQLYFDIPAIRKELADVVKAWDRRPSSIPLPGGSCLPLGERTLIMGILNVTPDSFSDGGRYNQLDKAVEHALEMEAEGADIIDIGGESTRPGSSPISAEEELKRVIPVVEKLASMLKVPISIDTYKSAVARQALQAGACILNDVWGLKQDQQMAEVAAESGAPICLMHNRRQMDYKNLIADIIQDLRESITIARQAGVRNEQVIIDPGIGFAKNVDHNLVVLRRLTELKSLGFPILLGTSRKTVIGKTLNLPADERIEGTAATVALGIAKGADIVRVHDVKEMVRVVRMTDAIVRRGGCRDA